MQPQLLQRIMKIMPALGSGKTKPIKAKLPQKGYLFVSFRAQQSEVETRNEVESPEGKSF